MGECVEMTGDQLDGYICWCEKEDEEPQLHHTDACNQILLDPQVDPHEQELDRFADEGNPHG